MNKQGFFKIIGYIAGGIILAIIIITAINVVQSGGDFFNDFTKFTGNWQQSSGEKIINNEVKNLIVNNIAGSIEIQESEDNTVKIIYQKRGPSEKALAAMEPVIQLTGTSLLIKRPDFNLKTSQGNVSFRLYLPKGLTSLKVETISGSIYVANIGQAVNQELSSVSGTIESKMAHNFVANSTSGSITFQAKGENISAGTISGSISGRLAATNTSRIKLTSVSGSISIKAQENTNYKFSFSTVSGRLSTESDPQNLVQKKGLLSGTYGSGSSSLTASTVSGSITMSIERPEA